MTHLVDVGGLADALIGPFPPRVLDVRWALAGPSPDDLYRAGHVPGAVLVDLDADLAGPAGPGRGRHPLPDPYAFGAAMRRAGVSADRPVVVYDACDATSAARAWWLLRHHGHRDVRVLDGGFTAWDGAGLALVAGPARPPEPGDFVPLVPGLLPVLDDAAAGTLARAGVLLDARVPARYRGEVEPVDPVAGHVPGAVSLPCADLVDGAGRLLAADRLRAVLADAGVRDGVPVGAYCGSGVTACQTLLALAVAGRPDAALYAGSWSAWVSDRLRPVATGADRG